MAVAETGTTDQTYDVISVIYHALNGAETYEQYIRDAEAGDDAELAGFFRSAHDHLCETAGQGRRIGLRSPARPGARPGAWSRVGRGRRAGQGSSSCSRIWTASIW